MPRVICKFSYAINSHLCEDILEFSQQGLAKFGGGWSSYQEMREQERYHLSTELEKAKRHRDKIFAERAQKNVSQEKRNRQGAADAKRGGIPKILLGSRKRRAQVTTWEIDIETYERTIEVVLSAHEALENLVRQFKGALITISHDEVFLKKCEVREELIL